MYVKILKARIKTKTTTLQLRFWTMGLEFLEAKMTKIEQKARKATPKCYSQTQLDTNPSAVEARGGEDSGQ
jgi:hypothetical protein